MHFNLYPRKHGEQPQAPELVELSRLPCKGEYIVLKEADKWYLVQMVVHAAEPETSDHYTRVYALAVDDLEAKKEAMIDASW